MYQRIDDRICPPWHIYCMFGIEGIVYIGFLVVVVVVVEVVE